MKKLQLMDKDKTEQMETIGAPRTKEKEGTSPEMEANDASTTQGRTRNHLSQAA
jgi:hypothetical protein